MSISRYITNRFLIIIGDWSSTAAKEEEKEAITDETLTTETKVKKQKV